MIIKSISCKSTQAVRNSIKYVLADHKTHLAPGTKKEQKHGYIPRWLTTKDLHYMDSEKADGSIMALLKEFKGTTQAFLQNVVTSDNYTFKDNELVLDKLLITHNVPTWSKNPDAKELIKAYEENEQYRVTERKNSNHAIHTILSFHASDTQNLSEQALRAIAERYVELKGSDGMYTFSLHVDRSHLHFHVIESSIAYGTATSMRMSKEKYCELKKEMQLFQQRVCPSLSHSSPAHGKGKETGKSERNFYKTAERSVIKQDLESRVTTILGKATTAEQVIAELQKSGYTTYYREGKPTGVVCENGMKVRFSRIGCADKVEALALQEKNAEKQLQDLRTMRTKNRERSFSRHVPDRKTDEKIAQSADLENELAEIQAMRENWSTMAEREAEKDNDQENVESEKDNSDVEPIEISALAETFDNEEEDNTTAI